MMGRELLTKRSHKDEEKENAVTKIFVGLEPAGQAVQSYGRRQINVSGRYSQLNRNGWTEIARRAGGNMG
jgi:hypothetical protein